MKRKSKRTRVRIRRTLFLVKIVFCVIGFLWSILVFPAFRNFVGLLVVAGLMALISMLIEGDAR